jgi:uncharacterized protein YndB with AHSA1/START domain
MTTNGELAAAGEAWQLRFTRRLAHSPQKVWCAITEPEHLAAWYPHTIVGEWVVGGPLRFESEGGSFDGEVLACDEPALLKFRWGADTIRIEIEPHEHGCTLTLIDTIDELGKAARDGAGWHVCLDRLDGELDGSAPTWTTSTRWREVHPDYVERFGPQAATIGPPEGALSEKGVSP